MSQLTVFVFQRQTHSHRFSDLWQENLDHFDFDENKMWSVSLLSHRIMWWMCGEASRETSQHHHGQHCSRKTVLQVPGFCHLAGPDWKFIVNKAQQRLYFLYQIKFNLPQELTQFYSAIMVSVLCSSTTIWFGSAIKWDIRRLQRTIQTTERIISQNTYSLRVRKRAGEFITDSTHTGLNLFDLLLSGW